MKAKEIKATTAGANTATEKENEVMKSTQQTAGQQEQKTNRKPRTANKSTAGQQAKATKAKAPTKASEYPVYNAETGKATVLVIGYELTKTESGYEFSSALSTDKKKTVDLIKGHTAERADMVQAYINLYTLQKYSADLAKIDAKQANNGGQIGEQEKAKKDALKKAKARIEKMNKAKGYTTENGTELVKYIDPHNVARLIACYTIGAFLPIDSAPIRKAGGATFTAIYNASIKLADGQQAQLDADELKAVSDIKKAIGETMNPFLEGYNLTPSTRDTIDIIMQAMKGRDASGNIITIFDQDERDKGTRKEDKKALHRYLTQYALTKLRNRDKDSEKK